MKGKISRKMLVGVFAVLIASSLASAALLAHFGQVQSHIGAKQLLLLDGIPGDHTVHQDLNLAGGYCKTVDHTITNQGSDAEEIILETHINSYGKGADGVDVDYGILIYSESIELDDGNDLEITVVEYSDWIEWNFDFPVEEWTGDGQINLGLIIAKDGIGEGPDYQIHNNDGATADYPHGDWLMSPWGPTVNDGWNGWHSGTDNTPTTSLSWVSASGERKASGTDGILQVRILKSELGDTFHWAALPTVGSGWYTPTQYLATPGAIAWDDPIVGADNYHEESTNNPWTVQPGATITFMIRYCLDRLIQEGPYTVTTRLV